MIQVLLFANLQEEVGKSSISLETKEITVGELKKQIQAEYHISVEKVMVAINEEYAEDSKLIKAGDTVALIPPVSGG